jgi:hypothetical protein
VGTGVSIPTCKGGHTNALKRKPPHEPDFSPDLITLLAAVNRWIRERFFRRIAGGGGLYGRLMLAATIAYWSATHA